MPIVGNGNAIDHVMRIPFCDRTFVVAFDRATADVADTDHWDAVHRKMTSAHADYRAAVRRWVTETNDVSHCLNLFL